MNKLFGFLAGGICGAIVGATAVLLFTPASGEQLRADAIARWESALSEARQAMQETQRDLETQFEQLRTS